MTCNHFITKSPIDEVLDHLKGIKEIGRGKYQALCPAHDDRKTSLTVTERNDGVVLLYCHAGCQTEKILDAIGLEKKDLFPPKKAKDQLAKKVVTTYDYPDPYGKLVYQVVRWDPKNFKQRRPDGKGGYIWNLQGIDPIPYRLPELLQALKDGKMILVVEGEKDVETVFKMGFTATCNHGGAGKWRESHGKYFPSGSNVSILTDNDVPGHKHGQSIAEQLHAKGCEVKIIELPGLPEHGDISDWLKNHSKAELQKIIDESQAIGRESWNPPIPFAEYDLPIFPVETLPEWLKNFVVTVAIATQTPLDMVGLLSLAMVGACVSKVFKVKARSGWVEPLNLYVIIVLLPGNRKSAVLAEVTAPMQEYEAELVTCLEADYRSAKAKRDALEQALSIAKGAYAKARNLSDKKGKTLSELEGEIEGLAHELAETKEPSRIRLICDDVTIERLAGLMAEQGGPMAMFTAEGGFINMMGGRYSQGQSNFDVVLKAHNGEEIRVDRVGREAEYIENPALTIGMAVQLAVLSDLTSRPEFKGKGLIARFIYAVPYSTIGNRIIDPPPVPEHVRHTYKNKIKKLLRAAYPRDHSQGHTISTITLGDDSKAILREYEAWLEPKMGQGGELESMQDWTSKLAGATIRIAGILHIAKNIDNPLALTTRIDAETMNAAITIGSYLISHAKAAFDMMGVNEDLESAKMVLNWIKGQNLTEFKKRDVYCSMHNRFKRSSDVDPALSLLNDYGYIKEVEAERKDQRKFLVNPFTVVAIDAVDRKMGGLQPLQLISEKIYVEKDVPKEEYSWDELGRVITGGDV